MDMALYKRVQDIADGLSAIEEKQNQKLDEALKEILELKTMVSVFIKSAEKAGEVKPKAQEFSKVKVQK